MHFDKTKGFTLLLAMRWADEKVYGKESFGKINN